MGWAAECMRRSKSPIRRRVNKFKSAAQRRNQINFNCTCFWVCCYQNCCEASFLQFGLRAKNLIQFSACQARAALKLDFYLFWLSKAHTTSNMHQDCTFFASLTCICSGLLSLSSGGFICGPTLALACAQLSCVLKRSLEHFWYSWRFKCAELYVLRQFWTLFVRVFIE